MTVQGATLWVGGGDGGKKSVTLLFVDVDT